MNIIEKAEISGELQPGMTIIEGTAGNTGIGLAMIGAIKGYPVKIVLPENVNPEVESIIKAYGGEVLRKPSQGFEDMDSEGYVGYLADKEGYFCAGQSFNPNNIDIHYRTTGPEIVEALGLAPDVYVAGVGTGGTLTGTGRYLKEKNPGIKIFAVEPLEANFLSGGDYQPHRLAGIGVDAIPPNLDEELYDEVIAISEDESIEMQQSLAFHTGLILGASSGATVSAALRLARSLPQDKKIVCIAADSGERYFQNHYFD